MLDENDNAPAFLHVAEGRELFLQVGSGPGKRLEGPKGGGKKGGAWCPCWRNGASHQPFAQAPGLAWDLGQKAPEGTWGCHVLVVVEGGTLLLSCLPPPQCWDLGLGSQD